jgi:hypothetical protein
MHSLKRHKKRLMLEQTLLVLGLLLLLGCASFNSKYERWDAAPLGEQNPYIWVPGQ